MNRYKIYDFEDLSLSTCMVAESIGSEYKRPLDKISYMVQKGELTPLARGFYAFADHPHKNLFINYNIANTIYGVSYLSTYTALDYYGLIADRVYSYTSMTLKRSKEINNARGLFIYRTLSEAVFSIGIKSIQGNDVCTFLIASPEKALCDLIWTTPRLPITSLRDMIYFLEEDIRFDMDFFSRADVSIFEECVMYGDKPKLIHFLIKLCNKE
jgi:predicted transcriptional regulator of viral defense system